VRLLLRTALLFAVVSVAHAGTAEFAQRVQGEKAECDFLLFLCGEANRAIDQAASTPGTADVIGFKNANLADMHVRDAVEAADVIARKHPPDKHRGVSAHRSAAS
jgi:hypothetical protein